MSKHTFLPKKQAVFALYEACDIKPPQIPQVEEFGYRNGKFCPTEADMTRRLCFLLNHLQNVLKSRLS